jgi:hypothetical protein
LQSSFYPRDNFIVCDEISLGGLHLALLNLPDKPRVVVQETINSFLDNLSCVLPSAGGDLPQKCLLFRSQMNFHNVSLAAEKQLSIKQLARMTLD